mmetsp:Transcript_17509/g.22123  ORF Transcript_17509/g.22123 Transcript_17509/m.22123 type:complete len:82 (+) Transcript_17509:425-670(+)
MMDGCSMPITAFGILMPYIHLHLHLIFISSSSAPSLSACYLIGCFNHYPSTAFTFVDIIYTITVEIMFNIIGRAIHPFDFD